MKFISILLTILLLCTGVECISASGCFDDSCHKSTSSDVHGGDVFTDHEVILYSTCISSGCHATGMPTDCAKGGGTTPKTSGSTSTDNGKLYTGTEVKMFTPEDSEWAAETMGTSGFGKMVALVDWAFKMSVVVVPILMILIWIVASALNKVDTGKWAIKGLFYIIVALMLLKIVTAAISSFTPDLSVVII